MTALLEVDDLAIQFGRIRAVDGVSFSVGEDELVALIGPNGAGKTATLNTMCGIYQPTEGDIRLRGRSLVGVRPEEIAARGVGRSFQHGELFGELTVVENLLVAMTRQLPRSVWVAGAWFGPYRRREAEMRERVEEVIDFFEIERHRNTPVASLPFGLQKLVGVARAMCTDPEILLLDEPSSGLTRQEKEDFARFLLRLRLDRRLPVLWIEHDMQMVMDLADRVVVLDYGSMIAVGPPEKIVDDPAVAEAYLGTSPAES